MEDGECKLMISRVRNRQKTVNNRFKFWGILTKMYCHIVSKHGDTFRSVVVITQLAIDSREELFQCDYKDRPRKNIIDA